MTMSMRGWQRVLAPEMGAGGGAAGAGAGGAGGTPTGGSGGAASTGPGAAAGGAGGGSPAAAGSGRGALAAAAQAAAAAAAGDGGGGQPGAAGIGHNGGPAFHPDGLPDTYKGATDRETIEKLWGGMPKPPAKADDYKIEAPPEFTRQFGDLNADPAMKVAREVALKNGLTQAQLSGFVLDFYGAMAKADLLLPPIDAEAELAKLMPKDGTPSDRRTAAGKRFIGVQNRIAGAVKDGWLSKVEANNLTAVTVTGEGAIALEKLFARLDEHGIQGGGQGAGNGGGQPAADSYQKALNGLYPTMQSRAA